MANLDQPKIRDYRGERELLVLAASAALWAGSAVEEGASGTLQNATGTGTTFAGFLLQSGTAAADKLELAHKGTVRLTVAKGSNWAATDLGATVYLTDGDTFTLSSSSAQAIGKVVEIESGIDTTSAVVWVYFEGVQKRSL